MPIEEAIAHSHRHGSHQHEHEHPAGDQVHEHGWHSPTDTCNGDDTFGRELNGGGADVPLPPPQTFLTSSPMLRPFRVVLPHVRGMLQPGVEAQVRRQTNRYDMADVSGSQYHYWAVVRDLWQDGQDFALVEHDIVIPAGCFDGFAACPDPWCVHDYEVFMGGIENKYGHAGAFGCVRFRAEILAAHPTLVADLFDRHWSHLDGILAAALRARGYESHRHHPDATHLHDYSHIPMAAREATAALHGVDPS